MDNYFISLYYLPGLTILFYFITNKVDFKNSGSGVFCIHCVNKINISYWLFYFCFYPLKEIVFLRNKPWTFTTVDERWDSCLHDRSRRLTRNVGAAYLSTASSVNIEQESLSVIRHQSALTHIHYTTSLTTLHNIALHTTSRPLFDRLLHGLTQYCTTKPTLLHGSMFNWPTDCVPPIPLTRKTKEHLSVILIKHHENS